MQSRSTCTKTDAAERGPALGGIAARQRFTAGRGAGCTAVHLALAGLRASATEITGMASTAKTRAGGFGRCAICDGNSKISRGNFGAA